MNKKYYWLKLKRDFFKRHDIKIIESMENGEKYLLFYLKLLVESLDHSGNLRFSDTIPYNEKMLSAITGTDIDIVRTAVKVFTELGMMEKQDDGTLFLSQVLSLTGDETEWAKKKREYREGQKEDNVLKLSDNKRTMSDKSLELRDKSIEIREKKEEEHFPFPPESQEVSKPEYNPVTRGNADAMTRIETARAYWNSKDSLPKYRYMAISMRPDDQGGALRTLGAYSDAEIKKAIDNYNTISTDDEYTPFPVYSTFAGFLKTGPENYGDDAKPLDRCRKKQTGPKEMTVEEYKAKFYPEEVNQEETEDDE